MERQAIFFARIRNDGKRCSTLSKSMKRRVSQTLEAKIRTRPVVSDLKRRNIVVSNANGRSIDRSLISKSRKLETNMKKARLSRALRRRPLPGRVHERIYPRAHRRARMDPKLVPISRRLTMEFKKDHLNRLLGDRPTVQELKKSNILHEKHGTISHRMQYKALVLERAFQKDRLAQSLRRRKPLSELHARGIVDCGDPHFRGYDDSATFQYRNKVSSKACLEEIQKASENLRRLRIWLRRVAD